MEDDTQTVRHEAGYGENPLSRHGPRDGRATRSPSSRLMRDEMPVMPTGHAVGHRASCSRARKKSWRRSAIPRSSRPTWTRSTSRTSGPMIPLQIDPPEHKKFRKLLDPLFAPRKMALLDDEVSALVNHLIDGFIDRGEVDFAKEFSIPFPSQVFLTLLGLPLEELDRFLTMKDGIIRPDHVTGKLLRVAGRPATTSRRSRTPSTTTSTRSSTSVRPSGATTCCRTSSTPRSRATGSAARTSSTSASSSSSPGSTRSRPRSTACSPSWPSTPSNGASSSRTPS